MKNYSFDSIIKDKAAGHVSPVPADAWNNIKKQKKKKRGIYWWAFIMLFIGLGLFSLYQMKYPAIIANQTNSKKNIAAVEKVKIISDSNDVSITTQPGQLNSKDSIVNNVLTEPEKNTAIKAAGKELLNTAAATDELTTIKPVKSSSNKKPADLNGREKAAKENNREGIINDNKDLVTEKPIKKTAVKSKVLWTSAKNKKLLHRKTKVKIDVPATGAAEEDQFADIAAVIAEDEKITVIDLADNSKDSMNTTPGPVVKNQLTTIDSTAKQVTKAVKRSKRTIFADISTMPFVPVQNSISLLNIKRITINNFSRSEFTADEISTSVNPALSYGIALRKKIAAKWFAGAGVQFVQIKENIKLSGKETNTIYSVVKRLDNTGSLLVDDTIATVTHGNRIINAINSYDFISIPIFMQYNLVEHKTWALSVNGGLNFTVKSIYKNSIEGTLVPAYITAVRANKKENKVTTDIFAAMCLARTAGKNFRLYAEPTLQFNLQQYHMPGIINYKNIHRAGLTIGVAYQVNY